MTVLYCDFQFQSLLIFLPFFQQTFFCFPPSLNILRDNRFATQEVWVAWNSLLRRSADFLFVFVCHTALEVYEWTIFHMTYLSCQENIQQKFSNKFTQCTIDFVAWFSIYKLYYLWKNICLILYRLNWVFIIFWGGGRGQI